MELPKTKLEQLELEHEATLTTVFFSSKKQYINEIRYFKSDCARYAEPR